MSLRYIDNDKDTLASRKEVCKSYLHLLHFNYCNFPLVLSCSKGLGGISLTEEFAGSPHSLSLGIGFP